MNSEYLKKSYGKNFYQIIDGDTNSQKLPKLWQGLANNDKNTRLKNLNSLFVDIFRHMPKTQAHLRETTIDAYVIFIEKIGNILVADRAMNGQIFSYRSFEPHASSKFGGSVGDFYSKLNGFCDFLSMGGLMPQSEILPLGEDEYEYCTAPSSEVAEKNKNSSYELIFNSGGKGKGYVNVDSTFNNNPLALILWLDDTEPLEEMEFWDTYDNWTFIGMQAD
jgi:hypothetical protein